MFPSVMAIGKTLSTVVAATVMNQGAVFAVVCEKGPSFPVEATTGMPFVVAWKEPIIAFINIGIRRNVNANWHRKDVHSIICGFVKCF